MTDPVDRRHDQRQRRVQTDDDQPPAQRLSETARQRAAVAPIDDGERAEQTEHRRRRAHGERGAGGEQRRARARDGRREVDARETPRAHEPLEQGAEQEQRNAVQVKVQQVQVQEVRCEQPIPLAGRNQHGRVSAVGDEPEGGAHRAGEPCPDVGGGQQREQRESRARQLLHDLRAPRIALGDVLQAFDAAGARGDTDSQSLTQLGRFRGTVLEMHEPIHEVAPPRGDEQPRRHLLAEHAERRDLVVAHSSRAPRPR